MASDINLLPDDDRRAEEREQRGSRGSAGKPVYSTPRDVVAPAASVQPSPIQTEVPARPAPKPAGPSLGQHLRNLLGRFGSAAATRDEARLVPTAVGVNLDVNLIPQETAGPSYATLWPLVGAVLGAALAVAAAFVGLGLDMGARTRALAEAQAKSAATAELLLGQQQAVAEMGRSVAQVRSVTGLLDSHIYWNRYFTWLESVTLPDVYYTGFMGDAAGTFTLAASARDYVTLAQQLVVLRADPRVQRVGVAEASRDSQGWVNFSMSLTVSPDVFVGGS